MSALDDIASAIRSRQAAVARLKVDLGEVLGRHARAASTLAAVESEHAEALATVRTAERALELAAGEKRKALAAFFAARVSDSGVEEAAERVERAMRAASERFRELRDRRVPAVEEARKELLRAEREARYAEERLAQETSLLDLDLGVHYSEWRESR